jgi:uncharacterized delta-60 repeat protein
LARYTPDGHPDPTFGTGGKVTTGPAPDADAFAVVVQADGKLVLAGTRNPVPLSGDPAGGIVLVRYSPSGSPDPTFGTGGRVVTTSPAGTFESVSGLALQADGKLATAGSFTSSAGFTYFALARYQAGGVGGLGFGISPQPSSVALGWATGSGQTGYLLARSPTAAWPLAADATTFTDPAPVRGSALNCYQLFALGASAALAATDALCTQLGVRSPIGPPPGFALRLDESTIARLTWGSSGDQLGYVLLALPQSGSPRTLALAAAARWATDATGGTPTCYVLYAVYAAGTGNTDAVCAVPGQARFGAAGQGAAAAPQTTRAPAVSAVEQQLAPRLQEGQTRVQQEAGKLRRRGR